jgi:hypothetical protein
LGSKSLAADVLTAFEDDEAMRNTAAQIFQEHDASLSAQQQAMMVRQYVDVIRRHRLTQQIEQIQKTLPQMAPDAARGALEQIAVLQKQLDQLRRRGCRQLSFWFGYDPMIKGEGNMSEEKKQMNVDAVIDSMKQKGERVSVKDVNDMLVDVEFTADQLEKIYETLENMGWMSWAKCPIRPIRKYRPKWRAARIWRRRSGGDFHPTTGAHVFKRDRQGSLLTADEEIDIAKRMEAGDADPAASWRREPAPGRFNRQTLCGPRHAVSGPDSGGQSGLIKAVEKFDYRKGY